MNYFSQRIQLKKNFLGGVARWHGGWGRVEGGVGWRRGKWMDRRTDTNQFALSGWRISAGGVGLE